MRKKMINLVVCAIILCIPVVSSAASTALERAFNRCMEGCVELDDAVCKQCCEKAFEPVILRCRLQFIECINACKNDNMCRNNCIYKTKDCGSGAKGEHVCP
ncbi:hypothetical protein [Desulfonatronum thiodismutans]|uniref:hypothetical protein n=1 Tax=Desulfonatronum thiodismutans TaxID=159290 RepID=UPI0012678AA2|nr:hypothetical protein [Desulfonatronum thiodismutans]